MFFTLIFRISSSSIGPQGVVVNEYSAPVNQLEQLLSSLHDNQMRSRTSLNLVPSENVLSPLARLPFVLDGYSRYFFDHMNKFGKWMFFGGIELGDIELDIVLPELRNMTGAPHVN